MQLSIYYAQQNVLYKKDVGGNKGTLINSQFWNHILPKQIQPEYPRYYEIIYKVREWQNH